jgi:hypothetical protein
VPPTFTTSSGFPSADGSGIDKVVIALTFAGVPRTGVLDPDMLYRIRIASDRRITRPGQDDYSLGDLLAYLEAVREKYLNILRPAEVRVTIDHDNRANLLFIGFPGGSFSASIATNQGVNLQPPKTAAQPSNEPTRTCAYAKFCAPGGARRGALPRRPGPRGGPLDRLLPWRPALSMPCCFTAPARFTCGG